MCVCVCVCVERDWCGCVCGKRVVCVSAYVCVCESSGVHAIAHSVRFLV